MLVQDDGVRFKTETRNLIKLNNKDKKQNAKTDIRNQKIRVSSHGFSHYLFLPLFGLISVFGFSLVVELIFLVQQYAEAKRVSNLVNVFSITLEMKTSIYLLDSSLTSLILSKGNSSIPSN